MATLLPKLTNGRQVARLRLSCLTKMRPNGCVFGWSGPNHRGLAFLNVTCACCWPCGHQFNRLTSITYPNFPGNNVTYNLRRTNPSASGNVVGSMSLGWRGMVRLWPTSADSRGAQSRQLSEVQETCRSSDLHGRL